MQEVYLPSQVCSIWLHLHSASVYTFPLSLYAIYALCMHLFLLFWHIMVKHPVVGASVKFACLSVTFVRSIQPVDIFCNVSSPFCTLAIR